MDGLVGAVPAACSFKPQGVCRHPGGPTAETSVGTAIPPCAPDEVDRAGSLDRYAGVYRAELTKPVPDDLEPQAACCPGCVNTVGTLRRAWLSAGRSRWLVRADLSRSERRTTSS